MSYTYKQLTANDVGLLKDLLRVFGDAFDDRHTYQDLIPSDAYLTNLLSQPHFITLVAIHDSTVVGGLTAYVLEKFEQDRREIYIYDLAVRTDHRRKGVATNLIHELKRVAHERNAYVIFVQADHGDAPAIALYKSLGIKEDVHHFDIIP